MRTVELQDTETRISAMVDEVEAGETVVVTRHSKAVAVLVSMEEWERVRKRAPRFADLLLRFPGTPEDIPERSRAPLRDADL
jgi:antitoxin Phd